MKRSLVPRGTQEGGPWGKVAGNLSVWQGGICPFRENDKRWSSQKGRSKKEHLEALGREDWKSTFRTSQKRKVSWGLLGGETLKGENSEKIRKR